MRNSVQIFLHHVENFFFSAAITVTVHKEVKEAVSKRDLTKKFILKKWTKKCETIPNTQSDFSPFLQMLLYISTIFSTSSPTVLIQILLQNFEHESHTMMMI